MDETTEVTEFKKTTLLDIDHILPVGARVEIRILKPDGFTVRQAKVELHCGEHWLIPQGDYDLTDEDNGFYLELPISELRFTSSKLIVVLYGKELTEEL